MTARYDITERAIAAETNRRHWHRLLGAVAMGLRPQRLVIAAMMLVAWGLILRLPSLWMGGGTDPVTVSEAWLTTSMRQVGAGVRGGDWETFVGGVRATVVGWPAKLMSVHPVATLAMVAALAAVWAVGGIAIARSTAVDFTGAPDLSLPDAIKFGLEHARSGWLAMVLPPALVLVLVLMVGVGGWLLTGAAWLRPVGALVFGIGMLATLAAMVIAVVHVLGMSLLTPAIACEGADSIDAVQRSAAYVILRPGRFFGLALVLAFVLLVTWFILMLAGGLHRQLTVLAVSMFADPGVRAGVAAALGEANVEAGTGGGGAGAWGGSTGWLLGFWAWIPGLLGGAVLTSSYFSGATIAYLLLRRANDGQHPSDLWMPGVGDVGDLDEESSGVGRGEDE